MNRPPRNSFSANGGSRSNHHINNYNEKNRNSGGYNRINSSTDNSNPVNQQEDLINYIYEAWDKVSREMDRSGGADVQYYQSTQPHRKFVPVDLNLVWGRHQVRKFPERNS